MKISELNCPTLINAESYVDDRGEFSKLLNANSGYILDIPLVDVNIVKTRHLHTFRGFHWQAEPYSEIKIIRCLEGRILDLCFNVKDRNFKIIDFELDGNKTDSLVVPNNFAHGYMTLTPHVTVLYGSTSVYSPDAEKGANWNDPELHWNFLIPQKISKKDLSWPKILDTLG